MMLKDNKEVNNTEAKIVGDGDIKCAKCHHMLSSSGREVGLVFWDLETGKWIVTCASERCSEVKGNTEVSDLQNYWLGRTMGGIACACREPQVYTKDNFSYCRRCGGQC